MSNVYLLQNQHHAWLDKSGGWITCGDRKQLFRTPHKDEAINQKVELVVKHPELRIEFVSIELDEKGLPNIDLPKALSPKDTDSNPINGETSERIANSDVDRNEPSVETSDTDAQKSIFTPQPEDDVTNV